MKKPDKVESVNGVSPPHFIDPSMKREYPRLYDAMASSCYEDGSRKGAGLLIIKPRSRTLSLTLKVDGSGLMLRCEGDSWVAALKALDALLAADPCPWEEDPYHVTKTPGKRKG